MDDRPYLKHNTPQLPSNIDKSAIETIGNIKEGKYDLRLIIDNKDVTPLPLTYEFDIPNVEINPEIPSDSGLKSTELDLDQSTCDFMSDLRISDGNTDDLTGGVVSFKEFSILLTETETIFLFEVTSISEEKGTLIGNDVEADNERYDYLTVGKGQNRKRITTETQTEENIRKTRHTMTLKIDMRDNHAFASTWDMYDSFARKDTDDRARRIDQDNLNDLAQNINFLNSAIITERVLANNVFKIQQENYKGISSESISGYLYYLWTFDCGLTQDKSVTSMSWNHQNHDMFAVGYGKYYYSDDTSGIVAVWSIKNPIQPERVYEFESPVTSVSFSSINYNLLCVGFYNGDVVILDVTTYEKKIVAQSNNQYPTYKPIWQVSWYSPDSEDDMIESVIAISQDGQVKKYVLTKTQHFQSSLLMTINRAEGLVKNKLKFPKYNRDILIVKHPPCLVLCLHPTLDEIYYVGTFDGCVYKCTTNFSNKHLDLFVAHDGPIFGMKYSNFSDRIFVTCGADSYIKVWIENVSEPLIVLRTKDPAESVVFHPTHSTIIAAISNARIYLWDLTNTFSKLLVESELFKKDKLTTVKFTLDGKNLIVSDVRGKIHVYSLPSFRNVVDAESDLLHESIANALKIRPDLLKKFESALKSHAN